MSKRALGWALVLALLAGFSGPASAEKMRMNRECTCICVATDPSGKRVEGAENFTFQTSGSDCSVGRKTSCFVGPNRGSYTSCTGKDIGAPSPTGVPPVKE